MLSIVLTASVLFPDITSSTILWILGVGSAITIVAGIVLAVSRRGRSSVVQEPVDRSQRMSWRMPPLTLLARPELSTGRRIGLTVLRGYLLVAMILVVVRVVQLALGH
jgi:hypothetical protein